MNLTKFVLSILVLALPVHLIAQETVKKDPAFYLTGIVKDASTGEVLPGVNVYLSGTTNGDMTNSEGVYSFRSDLVGTLDLVFSFVGFKRKIVKVHLIPTDDSSIKTNNIDAELEPETLNLRSIEVVSNNREWQKNYEQFVKQFIGQTAFARDTEILNFWVLEFEDSRNSGFVRATSQQPLVLENKALGYYLHIEIGNYEWAKTGQEGLYKVYPRFEEMEPKNEQEADRWNKNRKKAYEGSLQHFLTSLYHGNVREKGFSINSPNDLIPLSSGQVKFELLGMDGATPELVSVLKGYRMLREVQVDYGKLNDYQTNRFGGSPFNIKSTIVFPSRRTRTFFIDPLGNLFDPTSLKLKGEWAVHRMANRLPINYKFK